jgi:hypothetical protein
MLGFGGDDAPRAVFPAIGMLPVITIDGEYEWW